MSHYPPPPYTDGTDHHHDPEGCAACRKLADQFFDGGVRAEQFKARSPAPEPTGLDAIGRLAIEYVEDGERAWAEAKDPHETDDDLEPTWVAFRDEVKRLAARLAPKPETEG